MTKKATPALHDVRHRDAWLLVLLTEHPALHDDSIDDEVIWVAAAMVLLLRNPRLARVTLDDTRPLLAAVNRLKDAAAHLMLLWEEEAYPLAPLVLQALEACGWEPDIEGARKEIRRLRRPVAEAGLNALATWRQAGPGPALPPQH
jgi:hypothetical protein